jgi:hypothetical protein
VALVALVMSPLFGALLASVRRGIAASCVSRHRPVPPRTTEGARAGDGRTRTAGVQKAGAKR